LGLQSFNDLQCDLSRLVYSEKWTRRNVNLPIFQFFGTFFVCIYLYTTEYRSCFSHKKNNEKDWHADACSLNHLKWVIFYFCTAKFQLHHLVVCRSFPKFYNLKMYDIVIVTIYHLSYFKMTKKIFTHSFKTISMGIPGWNAKQNKACICMSILSIIFFMGKTRSVL
jgi:hypothetical protein